MGIGDLRSELGDLTRRPVIAVAATHIAIIPDHFSGSMTGWRIPPKLTISLRRRCATCAPL